MHRVIDLRAALAPPDRPHLLKEGGRSHQLGGRAATPCLRLMNKPISSAIRYQMCHGRGTHAW